MNSVLNLGMSALATASVTLTISRASIFKTTRAWLREKVPFIGKLVTCPYCTSHWVAFFIALSRDNDSMLSPLSVVFSTMVIVAMAAPVMGLMFISIKAMGGE